MNTTPDSIHLSEIIGRTYAHDRKLEPERTARILKRAVENVLRNFAEVPTKTKSKHKKLLRELQRGKKSLVDLHKEDWKPCNVVQDQIEWVKADLELSELDPTGKIKPPLWEFIATKISDRVASVATKAQFNIYAWNVSHEEDHDSDALAQRIDELDRSPFKDQLLQTAWAEYPDDARDLGLPGPAGRAQHSLDYRSMHWFGTDYTFTVIQAVIVKILWEAWEAGAPEVGTDTLLEAADSKTSRLIDLFRGCSAWGTMIVDGSTKGSKQLSGPPTS